MHIRIAKCVMPLILLLACACAPVAQTQPLPAVRISVDPGKVLAAANRNILGNNIQWVDDADGLIEHDSGKFVAGSLEHARRMGSTILRYPGGAQSDLYHWRDGVGESAKRGENRHFFSHAKQRVRFGTQEFLEYCEAVGAQPLITVNTATGTPEEAAEWVKLANVTRLKSARTGKPLPKVVYWEIGNEPYVNDGQNKDLWITPEKFAARANTFIHAMKAVDSSIQVGIPLRSDKIGTVPATPHQGYNRKVLGAINAPFEFVALHNAYLPFNYMPDKRYKDEDYYRATMAASRVIVEDFNQTRALLRELKPGKTIPLAVTEYNALYQLSQNEEAKYITTMAGAMFVADALRVFATTPDLAFANFWSLGGNWHFGALDNGGQPRPAYHALNYFNMLLQGNLIAAKFAGGTFANRSVGVVPSYEDTPTVAGLATRSGNVVRLLLINKEAQQVREATLEIAGAAKPVEIKFSFVTSTNPLAAGKASDVVAEYDGTLATAPLPVSFKLPPCSIVLLTVRLAS